MKTYKVWYEETYGKMYEVSAEHIHEAEDKLRELIQEGKEDGPEECTGSALTGILGNNNPDYQIMGAKIDTLGDEEKKFYLWHLLRYYYKKELLKGKEKCANNAATVDQINKLLNWVEELDTLLCYDLY